MSSKTTTVLAGIAAKNATLFHRLGFVLPDAAAVIDFAGGTSVLIVRDLEMERSRQQAPQARVCCSADFVPEGGLSADRDTALAQATAECLRRAGEIAVTVERTLPYLYAHFIREAGIAIDYSADFGVGERRIKRPEEIDFLRHAQKVTGEAVSYACRMIANAKPDKTGTLFHDGSVLTSERVRYMITAFLMGRNFSNHHDSIVASAPHAADCHHFGTGPLKVGLPVIVDIFPMDNATRYNGDMTRTVVCGEPIEEALRMQAAVSEAKAAGCAALRPGATGEGVHLATIAVLEKHGYGIVRGDVERDLSKPAMTCGTGHGLGLEVHEPILLDHGGGEIFQNEVFTVEPGLYSSAAGGCRIEDAVVVTADGHEILAPIHEGLDWAD